MESKPNSPHVSPCRGPVSILQTLQGMKDIRDEDIEHGRQLMELTHKAIEEENVYKSCCLTVDKRALQFFTQFILTIGVMTFSMVKLSTADKCEDTQVYIGLISLAVGVFLPTPKMNKDN